MRAWLAMNTVLRAPRGRDRESKAAWMAKRQRVIDAADTLRARLRSRTAAMHFCGTAIARFGAGKIAWAVERGAAATGTSTPWALAVLSRRSLAMTADQRNGRDSSGAAHRLGPVSGSGLGSGSGSASGMESHPNNAMRAGPGPGMPL